MEMSRSIFVKLIVAGGLVVAASLGTFWIFGWESFLHIFPSTWRLLPIPNSTPTPASLLSSYAVERTLREASPIFGQYDNVQSDTSTWMSRFPDSTKLVHMNIPGVHDAATWNYSVRTRDSLKHITSLISDVTVDPTWFRCQEKSIIDMLNAGIRAFDLRYAQDVTKSTLVFWHGPALQSQTATIDSVLFAFYHWLMQHSSETVLLSFQYEPSEAMGNAEDDFVQRSLYDSLTSPAARQSILQTRNSLGTLGSARGKVILLRRFDMDRLPAHFESTLPGVHFSPKSWTANAPNGIKLTYRGASDIDGSEEGVAYIEDYYQPRTRSTSTLDENIAVKLNATEANLRKASSDSNPNGLFWTFTSGTKVRNRAEVVTPRKMALGSNSESSIPSKHAVNPQLREFFKNFKRKRLGIVMFDYFDQPHDLLSLFLSLQTP